jgi:rod shape determining protein RodA
MLVKLRRTTVRGRSATARIAASARHTDFIFSVFAEEHRFSGSVRVFTLFAVLSYIALEIARTARDHFSSMLAIGTGSLLFVC